MFGYSEVFTPDGPVFEIFEFNEAKRVREDDQYTYDIDVKKMLFCNNKKYCSGTVNLTYSQFEDWTSEKLENLTRFIIKKIFRTIHSHQVMTHR